MMTLVTAMAREEGFYARQRVPTRAQRNHNPGDLEYGAFARAHGATASDGRFAIFPDDTTGFNAMRALLLSKYGGQTLQQMLDHYAPPKENQTSVYLQNVCAWAGVKPTDRVDQHLGA